MITVKYGCGHVYGLNKRSTENIVKLLEIQTQVGQEVRTIKWSCPPCFKSDRDKEYYRELTRGGMITCIKVPPLIG